MMWRKLAFCAVLTTACSVPVPPREAFPVDADDTAAATDGDAQATDAALDSADAAPDGNDTVTGTDAADVGDAAPGTDVGGDDAGTDAADAGDASDALDAAEDADVSDAPDTADAADDADAADADLCANVTCTDLPCATQACAPATGKCVATPKVNGWACDDGKKCTDNDVCTDGVCAGTTKSCDDGNACTNDGCNASLGCTNTVVKAGTACEDGDACTVGDVCVATTCTGKAKLFEATIGTAAYEQFLDVAPATDGLIAAGYTYGSLPIASGTPSLWLVKTDLAGAPLWQNTYGGAGSGMAYAVLAVADGVVAAGADLHNGVAKSDGWILKTDATGTEIWSKSFGAAGSDAFADVIADGDGFLAVGQSTIGAPAENHAWLVRVDGTGGKTWEQTFPTGGTQRFTAVAATGDGFACVGQTAGPSTANDAWLVRLDAGGNKIWERQYGGSAADSAQDVIALDDGFAIGGTTASSGAGGADFWLIRTDAVGNVLWNRTYGGADADSLQNLAVIGGDFLLSGDFSFGSTTTAHIVRTDALGNVVVSTGFSTGIQAHALVDGGSLLLAGRAPKAGNADDGWLLRTDLWGNATCSDSGACVGFTTECDDNNPCTTDLCGKGVTGCWHFNVEDGVACGSGSACKAAETCSAGVCGGGGDKLFDKTLVGTPNVTGPTCLAFAAGGFAIAATTQGALPSPRLVRTDAVGTALWDKTYSLGSYAGSVTALLATGGGFAMAGTVGSDNNGDDCFLLTTDGAGTQVVNVELGDSGADSTHALAAVPDGFALAGATTSFGVANRDGYLIRTDTAGAVAWQKTYDGANADSFNAIAARPDGFALAGITGSTSDATGHAWLVRTDLNGALLWTKTFSNGTFDVANAVVAVPDGFLVVGATNGAGAGANDAWLIRTDSNGVKLWSRTYGTTANDSAASLTVDGYGIALAGASGSQGYVVRTDLDGNKLWDRTVGSGSTQSFQASIALADGFATAGTVKGSGIQNLWLLRTDLYGNASCASSGTCAGLSVPDCDDGNPCTADLCDAAHSGCWHTNMADGLVCAYGATCGAGVCACTPGYIGVTGGEGKVCAADGPVWGLTPFSPANLNDNGNGTVSDDFTGLMWQQADPGGLTYTWDQANQFCIGLKLGNHADWRLPTLAELNTLIDFNKSNPATANLLQTNVNLAYWSATLLANATNNAWGVSFVIGTQQAGQLTFPNHTRCVRGTTAGHAGARFTTTTGTVTDTWTGLLWERAPSPSGETTVSAKTYCDGLVLEGSTGWRIPTIVELRSIVDRSVSGPAIDSGIFPGTPSEWFWASSGAGGSSNDYWSVYFSEGISEGNGKVNTFRVRCVK